MSLTYGFGLDGSSTLYDSRQFSDVFHALAGDGITPFGMEFSLALRGGFSLELSSGYAMLNGRWVKNTESVSLFLPPSGAHADRYDAVALRADNSVRAARIEVLSEIDPTVVVRSEDEYVLYLYTIHVRRGNTVLSPGDVTDVRSDSARCGYIVRLSDASQKALRAYLYLTDGLDGEEERLLEKIRQALEKAEDAIAGLDTAIEATGAAAAIGELRTAVTWPVPQSEWLLCDGGAVPAEYPKLSALLNGTLPDVENLGVGVKTYIFGGIPEEVSE